MHTPPVTPHSTFDWEGLRSTCTEHVGWENSASVKLGHARLVFHISGSRAFEVTIDGVKWKFRGEAGFCDYYPDGCCDLVRSGPGFLRSLTFEIPQPFESCILEEGGWHRELSPKFQFRDRRLEGLIGTLRQGRASGVAGTQAVFTSVALVDRLYEINASASKEIDTAQAFTPTVHRLIIEYIDQYIGAPDHLSMVPFLTGIGRTQFAHMFRASFGMPLHQFIISRRIVLATRRLLDNVKVTELSQELGFASHAHFSTVFRSHTGHTPSEFRKNMTEVSAVRGTPAGH